MPLQSLGQNPRGRKTKYEGYRKMELIVDSGAAASVIPQDLLSDHPITPGEASKRGVNYLAANGDRVPNLGEMKLTVATKEQFVSNMTFQVASVNKPILSVGEITKSGNKVEFDTSGGTITHLRSRKKIHFKKRGGIYILEVLVAPWSKGTTQLAALESTPAGTAEVQGSPVRTSASADSQTKGCKCCQVGVSASADFPTKGSLGGRPAGFPRQVRP